MAMRNVAVAVKSKENSAGAVRWTLQHLVSEPHQVLTIIHVRPPLTHVPSPVGKLPISQVDQQIVEAFKQEINFKTDHLLKPFVQLCENRKVGVEPLVLESDSVQKALVQEIFRRGITKLVLGASNRNVISRRLMGPGLTAVISQSAPDFCSVYTVARQKLQSVKQSRSTLDHRDSLSQPLSQNSESTSQSQRSSISSLGEPEVLELVHEAEEESEMVLYQSQPLPLSANVSLAKTIPLRSQSVPHRQASNFLLLAPGYNVVHKQDHSRTPNLIHQKQIQSQPYKSISDQLEAYYGPEKRLTTEACHTKHYPSAPAWPQNWSISSSISQSSYNKDEQLWELEPENRANEGSGNQGIVTNQAEQEEIFAAEMARKFAALRFQKASSHLEALLHEAPMKAPFARQLSEEEHGPWMKANEKPIQNEKVKVDLIQSLRRSQQYRIYSYDEILAATSSMSEDNRLGEGGYGIVYKGKLHHTNVAIKVLKENASQGLEEFQHEVEVLGLIHHPHILLLLGCCPEKACLVYEFMANGSLEDRLKCRGGTRPLPWYTRTRIAEEVATALFFLHSSKPEPIVHRDLKPGNVLLDQNLVSKIGDVGLASLVPETLALKDSTFFCDTRPVGTFAYIDPEYQHTGYYGPKSDVYAFGILLLQLLTGRHPVGIIKNVKDSFDSGTFVNILDKSAGDWPLAEATKMAILAFECTQLKRKNRPDIASILPTLDKIRDVAEEAAKGITDRPILHDVPHLFLCPILKELMEDPVIAADGYTYEREAIEHWLQKHDTSPLTNLPLAHCSLIPNCSLRTGIKEWMSARRIPNS